MNQLPFAQYVIVGKYSTTYYYTDKVPSLNYLWNYCRCKFDINRQETYSEKVLKI